jgi:hypothetical protein
MELIHTPDILDAENPGLRIAFNKIRQKLYSHLARLSSTPAEHLVLIGHPGTGKTMLSNQIVQIEAVEPSLQRNPASQSCWKFIAKSIHHAVRHLKELASFKKHLKPTPRNNTDSGTFSEQIEFASSKDTTIDGDPYLPALIASIQLRKWVISE